MINKTGGSPYAGTALASGSDLPVNHVISNNNIFQSISNVNGCFCNAIEMEVSGFVCSGNVINGFLSGIGIGNLGSFNATVAVPSPATRSMLSLDQRKDTVAFDTWFPLAVASRTMSSSAVTASQMPTQEFTLMRRALPSLSAPTNTRA